MSLTKRCITDFKKQNTGTIYTQTDESFEVNTNYSLPYHQVTLYTDSIPTTGTATITIDLGTGVYEPLYINDIPVTIDLTNPRSFEISGYVDTIKITLADFDNDKLVGALVYSYG